MSPRAKQIAQFLGVSTGGFVAGALIGSVLFGYESSAVARLAGGAMSILFCWLYPLGFAAAWPLFSVTLKMGVLAGVLVLPTSSALWFVWKRRSYLAAIGVGAALIGLPNALILAAVMSV